MNEDNSYSGGQQKYKFPKQFEKVPGTRWLLNPGNIESLHLKQRQIFPSFFNGISVEYSNSLQASRLFHWTWCLSPTTPSGFTLGGISASGCTKHGLLPPILRAEFNPITLASSATAVFFPVSWLHLHFELQRLRNVIQMNAAAEVSMPKSTLTLKLYDPKDTSGRISFSCLRKMTKRLDLGGELLLEWNRNYVTALTAFAARYGRDDYEIGATVSLMGMDLSYWRKLTKDLQIGSSLAFNNHTGKILANICYQWHFSDATIKAMIDSDWLVGFSYFR